MNTYRTEALIGGVWIAAPGASSVENPATETVFGSAAMCDKDMTDHAVSAARLAAPAWGRSTPSYRADILDSIVDVLRARRDQLVDVTVSEVGVSKVNARASHVDLAIELLASAATNARAYLFEETVGGSLLIRKPVGVVACITPWNYPLYQLAAKVGPALAAGCTIVLKPAELAPLSSYLFAEATITAGLPAGVFNLVPGAGRVVGEALTANPDVDMVSFTGSTTVGRTVGAAAAANLTRACLELGGKSSSIVCEDADLDAAVRSTVDSAMLNSGQTCSALTRLLVSDAQYEAALSIAGDHARSLVVGDPQSEETDLGPLISAKQRDDVVSVVDQALARGARLVAGDPSGLPETGYFVPATILADLDPSDPASQSEIFGPVLVVHRYTNEHEAVEISNGTRYGLSGAVWSASDEHARDIARQMDTGQVDLNGAEFNPNAPFGGWKDSGYGRELGMVGLEEYTEITSVQM